MGGQSARMIGLCAALIGCIILTLVAYRAAQGFIRALRVARHAEDLHRGKAFVLLSLFASSVLLVPFLLLGMLLEASGRQGGLLDGVLIGAIFGVSLGVAAGGGTVVYRSQFRYMVRLARKRLGVKPIL